MPITNFFVHAAAIDFVGCLNMTIKKEGEQLTVSVMLQNQACGDSAKAHIPPLVLRGSLKELCEGFFDAIAAPVAQTSALLVNMEQYLKGQEAAMKNAAANKKKAEGDTLPQKRSPEEMAALKYANAMAGVDALEKEGKFKEAWMKVPQPTDFPEKAEEIRARRAVLSARFSSPDLFRAAQPAEPINEVEPNTQEDATDDNDAEGLYDEGEQQ